MAFAVLATHLLFALVLFAVSAGLTWAMLRVGIMDVPNHRSSHQRPVPSTGGVAIVATFFIGFAAVYLLSDDARIAEIYLTGFAAASVGIAVVSFLDDLGRLRSFAVKLGAQIAAALVLVAFGMVFRSMTLPGIGSFELGLWAYPVTVIWLVAMTNMFNFMDGLDGLAAGTAVIAAAFFAVLTFVEGSLFVYILCYVLLASALGFLVFNFPPARIFMGDVGSQFLGFSFAAIAVIAAEYDASRTTPLIMPLLFFHFIFDTGFTFFRRLIAGENVTRAHRGHLYQLLNQIGYSHLQVSLFHAALALAQGLGAVWMLSITSDKRILVFLPFLAFEIVYCIVVTTAARRRGMVHA
jgi:UDP-N-acetylmuramyl pentapeptide phosphotransferase/UDP-N-acetylglucosamine-1-phosphate transferase